ncbi:MAG: Fe-S protein assembly co-chaperone HscB [Janthinobacterium lividum]
MQNHFELFHLPQQFGIDLAALSRAYHEVQNQVHPDKFASQPEAEKRVAMQWATRANEAYQVLRNPLKRAAYLCELNGIDLQTESNTAMPRDFLMQQMEWRENLDEAKEQIDAADMNQLATDVAKARDAQLKSIASQFDSGDSADMSAAAQGVRQLMFLEKFGDEVAAALDRLADQAAD